MNVFFKNISMLFTIMFVGYTTIFNPLHGKQQLNLCIYENLKWQTVFLQALC